jgi:hypothetical protein
MGKAAGTAARATPLLQSEALSGLADSVDLVARAALPAGSFSRRT